MIAPNISDYPLSGILPGQSKAFEIAQLGANCWYVMECSHSRFEVQINDGARLRGRLAFGRTFRPDFSIEKVRVYNVDETGLPLDITIQAGEGEPIDNVFQVQQNEVTPILRSDTPLIIGEAVLTAPGDVAVDTWKKIADADEFRAEVKLITDAAVGEAFWNTVNPGGPAEFFSRDIKATADTGGFLSLKTTAEIWVRLKAAKSVRALTFKYSV